MELRYNCPQCGTVHVQSGAEHTTVLSCSPCGYAGLLPADWTRGSRVELCPICGCRDLYRQKDFNHRLAIVVLLGGAVFALPLKGLSVVAAAILVLVLYLTAPEILVCYLCRAHIRGHLPGDGHGRFDADRHDHN